MMNLTQIVLREKFEIHPYLVQIKIGFPLPPNLVSAKLENGVVLHW